MYKKVIHSALCVLLTAIMLIPSAASAAAGIEQFGDSTTSGLTWNGTSMVAASVTAPDRLFIDMTARFGAGNVIVYNRGVPGSCAKDLLYGPPTFDSRMASSSANIVTINYGMNDDWYCKQTVDQYAYQVTQLISIAKSHGKLVVLIEPNPTTNVSNPNLYSYIAALSQVSSNNNVPIIQHYRIWTASGIWRALLSDGTHPTGDGYVMKGDTEFQVLSPMVQKLLSP